MDLFIEESIRQLTLVGTSETKYKSMPFEPAANREIPSLTLHNEMLHNSATQGDNAMSLLSTYLLQGWVSFRVYAANGLLTVPCRS